MPGAAKSPCYGIESSQIRVTPAVQDIGAVHMAPACIAVSQRMLANVLRSTCSPGDRRDGNDHL